MHLPVPLCEYWLGLRAHSQLFFSYCPCRGWSSRLHTLRIVFEAHRRCLAILTDGVSSLGVVIRGRLDLGLSLTCSGYSLCLPIINDTSSSFSMCTLDTGWTHPSRCTPVTWAMVVHPGISWSSHAKLGFRFLQTLVPITAHYYIKIGWILTKLRHT